MNYLHLKKTLKILQVYISRKKDNPTNTGDGGRGMSLTVRCKKARRAKQKVRGLIEKISYFAPTENTKKMQWGLEYGWVSTETKHSKTGMGSKLKRKETIKNSDRSLAKETNGLNADHRGESYTTCKRRRRERLPG